ncbi:MAG TPA: hypothetical protein VF719_12860 [Abditibacteriaceae bacterium]
MRWTRKGIVAEIKKLHAEGVELNYATAEANNLNLVRAAAWHFGTWRRAVEAAGIDYQSVCKYRRWDRDRITARIRELHSEGADLSWRSISLEVDPPLAAAALRKNGFSTWREAIAAAGLDINEVARYQYWDEARVLREIKALQKARVPLSSKLVQHDHQKLFFAARRRFGSWDEALAASGLKAENVRLRRAYERKPRQRRVHPDQLALIAEEALPETSVAQPAARRRAKKVEPEIVAKPAKTVASKPIATKAVTGKTASKKAVAPQVATVKTARKDTAKPDTVKPAAKGVKSTSTKIPVAKTTNAKMATTKTATAKTTTAKTAAAKPAATKKPAAKSAATKPAVVKAGAKKSAAASAATGSGKSAASRVSTAKNSGSKAAPALKKKPEAQAARAKSPRAAQKTAR